MTDDRRLSRYRSDLGRNVEEILCSATRVIKGPIPRDVRRELMAAVKIGALGHFKKDGLKPEIFFHPDHENGAIERQQREADYSAKCISSVMYVKPVGQRVAEAIASVTGKRDSAAVSLNDQDGRE